MEQQQSLEVQRENPPACNTADFGKTQKPETTGNVDYWELLAELRIG